MNPDLKLSPEHQAVFDSIPEDSPRSRLDPYRALILRWRGQRKTYRRIRELLSEKFSIQVSTAMVHKFVQRHNRPRKPVDLELQAQTAIPQQTGAAAAPGDQQPTGERKRLTMEERIAQAERIRAIRMQPVVPREPVKKVFEYDPSKPLVIDRSIKD